MAGANGKSRTKIKRDLSVLRHANDYVVRKMHAAQE
jgi:hypothetical protein